MILLVEDRADDRALFGLILRNEGWTVRDAGSATEALRMVYAEHPRLVITDIMMPREDGFALAHEIRNDRALDDVEIMFFTAFPEAKQRAAQWGITEVLMKPALPVALVAAVSRLIGPPPARVA